MAVAGAVAALPAPADAASAKSFGPVGDAYVVSSAPRARTFRSRRLHVGARPVRRAYLRFQLHGLNGPVQRAVLRLWALNRSRTGFDVRMSTRQRLVSRRLTFRTAPPPGPTVRASRPFHSRRWVSVDVTPAVRRNGTLTFVLTTRSRRMIALASREAGRGFAPRLLVTYGRAPSTGSPLAPPIAERPPIISGTPVEKQALTAHPGNWRSAQPLSFAYQWRRCKTSGNSCSDIGRARAATYTVTGRDVGRRLRVVVTASNAAGAAQQISDPTPIVTQSPRAPSSSSPPAISGTAADGQALKASAGSWRGTRPIAFAYQWRRCSTAGATCADVPGATASTYVVSADDFGATLRVAVTAANVAGSATAVSKPTRVVAGAAAPFARTVSLWHMDELDGDTMADSVGGSNGKLHNVVVGQPGRQNTAFAFNGANSVVVVAHTDRLNPGATSFAFGVSVKFTQHPRPGGSFDLIRKGVSSSAGGDYKLEIVDSGKPHCQFRGSEGVGDATDGPDLADGAWHSIQCFKRETSVGVVVDGRSYNRPGVVVGAIANTVDLTIGAKPDGTDWFPGLIDEVSLATT